MHEITASGNLIHTIDEAWAYQIVPDFCWISKTNSLSGNPSDGLAPTMHPRGKLSIGSGA